MRWKKLSPSLGKFDVDVWVGDELGNNDILGVVDGNEEGV